MALVDNLYEHWALESALTGSKAVVNLTQVGSAFSYTTAIVGNGIVGAGASGRYLTFPYNTAIPAGTISFWYKTTGDGTGSFHRTFAKTQVGVTDVCVIGFTNYGRRPYLLIGDTVIISEASDTLTRDTWYHHAITWNGSTIIWYVNGVATYTVSSTKTVASNTTVWSLLGWNGNSTQQPAAVMDEPGLWLRALTATEVGQLYNAGAGLAYPFNIATPYCSNLLMMGVG